MAVIQHQGDFPSKATLPLEPFIYAGIPLWKPSSNRCVDCYLCCLLRRLQQNLSALAAIKQFWIFWDVKARKSDQNSCQYLTNMGPILKNKMLPKMTEREGNCWLDCPNSSIERMETTVGRFIQSYTFENK